MWPRLVLVLLSLIQFRTTDAHCGYEQCDLGREGYLNVHLVPHTHDDVGWLKTVDQYYYGSMNHIQKAGVQYILDSVIQSLNSDSRRRFTYVEMAFFSRWWRAQTLQTRQLVQQLVQDGRLQFAHGAWSMADEATVHYGDAVDQMTRGHDLLNTLFGKCGLPRVAWQIDPFGHARDHAEIFRDAGLDAVFFQRVDYREKSARKDSKSLEFLWDTGLRSNQSSPGLFTSMFYDSYCYPKRFCFDDKCQDEPIRDDPLLEGYNVDARVNEFLDYVNRVNGSFATQHIMVLMGCDFTYENANMNFNNMDKLIQYVNQRQSSGSRVNMMYSTPPCYTKAVNNEFKRIGRIERRTGDFFPYASGPDSYWTGYYTSRPALKAYVRHASTLLSMCEQMHLFVDRIPRYQYPVDRTKEDTWIDQLRQAMGVMQHHDAVTGTEKQHVADDYVYTLSKSIDACQQLISKAASQLIPNLPSLTGNYDTPLFCDQLNISLCAGTADTKPYLNATGQGGVYIMVYNPNSWNLWSHWVRIPVYLDTSRSRYTSIKIRDMRTPDRKLLAFQMIPVTQRTISIPERHSTDKSANMELIFNAGGTGLPLAALSYTMFQLVIDARHPHYYYHHRNHPEDIAACPGVSVVSQTTKISLEVATEQSSSNPIRIIARHLGSGNYLQLNVEMLYYFGETHGTQASGAYVFLPKGKNMLQHFSPPTYRHFRGECVEEVHLTYTTWATLVIRLYADGQLETEWTVGPIPDQWNQFSREVVLRYTVHGRGLRPGVQGEFFTDSAGRRMIRRVRNRRPEWNISYPFYETQPVSGNYYPVINRLMLKGQAESLGNGHVTPAMGFVVYTDRAQGGSSLHDGELELMVHRRLVRDDGFGVGEPLLENGEDNKGLIVRGRHVLRLDELRVLEKEDPVVSRQITKQPILLFAPSERTPQITTVRAWNGLNIAIPPNLNLLSLVAWPLLSGQNEQSAAKRDQILVRFENLANPGGAGSHYGSRHNLAQIDVTNMLRGVRILRATEVTLTAQQEISVAKSERLQWPTESPYQSVWGYTSYVTNRTQNVILSIPEGEIGTYLLDYH